MPRSVVSFSQYYGTPSAILTEAEDNQTESMRWYPRYYFKVDDTLGFDIDPGQNGTTAVDGLRYTIFANDIGCFDLNNVNDFLQRGAYYYFAGDSFTWGFSRYEHKFPTVWEKLTGHIAAKCGVTHTGTLHQFDKFKKVTTKLGIFPKMVFVGFYYNDISNDFAYPHSTVLSGFLVDIRGVYLGKICDFDLGQLYSKAKTLTEESAERVSSSKIVGRYLLVYSLTANLAYYGAKQFRSWAVLADTPCQNIYAAFSEADLKNNYLTSAIAERNRNAFRLWQRHAEKNGYSLVVILIPPKKYSPDPHYFDQVKNFFDSEGISYVDFAQIISRFIKSPTELYWEKDPHLNENGNVFLASELAKLFK